MNPLANALDGAHLVRCDDDREVVIAWFGGHGVHAFSLDGRELDFWNVDTFERERAERSEVIASIDEWLATDAN
jgi:hypothetical protein